jgi:hypothetical protein
MTFTFAKYNYNYQVKEDKTGRACSTHGKKTNAYRTSVRKPEEKNPLGRPRSRLEDNIKMDFTERGRGGLYWSEITKDRD